MREKRVEAWLRNYLFHLLALIFLVTAAVLFFLSNGSYDINGVQVMAAVQTAGRWYPACFVCAVTSTGLASVQEGSSRHKGD